MSFVLLVACRRLIPFFFENNLKIDDAHNSSSNIHIVLRRGGTGTETSSQARVTVYHHDIYRS